MLGSFCFMNTRTYVYADGCNLYYRALRGTKYKWLDLTLSTALLSSGNQIDPRRNCRTRFTSAKANRFNARPLGPESR